VCCQGRLGLFPRQTSLAFDSLVEFSSLLIWARPLERQEMISFLLRFTVNCQESAVSICDTPDSVVVAGTKTATEIRRESDDRDPKSQGYCFLPRQFHERNRTFELPSAL